MVRMDAYLFEQVLVNIIKNAAESIAVSYTHLDVYKRQAHHDVRTTVGFTQCDGNLGYSSFTVCIQQFGTVQDDEKCIRDRCRGFR